ncbi:MAG: ABC transporter substrate-binding protein [Burkholderiales bacterium]|nr:ABC transporter substrate-binding protein [Burkholderiales bacterium]
MTVNDTRGNIVTLATAAQRIITLSPHAAELVFATGAGAQLIAVSEHSDAPPAVKTLPVIGNANALDLERIIALKPSLIVSPSWLSAAQRQTLQTLRIAVYVADAPTPEAIADDIEALGVLSGHEEEARAAAQRYRARLKAITASVALGAVSTQASTKLPSSACGRGVGGRAISEALSPSPTRRDAEGGVPYGHPSAHAELVEAPPARGGRSQKCVGRKPVAPLTVFYQLWNPPLYTAGGGSLIDQAITRCGGRNIFASLTSPSPIVSREAVIEAQPQVILMGASEKDFAHWKEEWQRWPQIPAVRRQAFIRIDPDLLHRPGPRFAEGMAALCEGVQVSGIRYRESGNR